MRDPHDPRGRRAGAADQGRQPLVALVRAAQWFAGSAATASSRCLLTAYPLWRHTCASRQFTIDSAASSLAGSEPLAWAPTKAGAAMIVSGFNPSSSRPAPSHPAASHFEVSHCASSHPPITHPPSPASKTGVRETAWSTVMDETMIEARRAFRAIMLLAHESEAARFVCNVGARAAAGASQNLNIARAVRYRKWPSDVRRETRETTTT